MKGGKVSIFKVGQFVEYKLRKLPDATVKTGIIHKLHMIGSSGVAEIKPSDGSRKVSRRLIHVSPVRR